MTDAIDASLKPQDDKSGLVERVWVRTSRKRGIMTENPLEGSEVAARSIDRYGVVQRVNGRVTRNREGELVVESWADGIRQETAVPRDASVEVNQKTEPKSL